VVLIVAVLSNACRRAKKKKKKKKEEEEEEEEEEEKKKGCRPEIDSTFACETITSGCRLNAEKSIQYCPILCKV
jgi:hypothetical protein